MMATITYTNGLTLECIIQVWHDLNTERSGMYRAFWCASPEAESGSPVIGYCSPGGSHRTVKAVVAEVRRLGYTDPIYRNGRRIA